MSTKFRKLNVDLSDETVSDLQTIAEMHFGSFRLAPAIRQAFNEYTTLPPKTQEHIWQAMLPSVSRPRNELKNVCLNISPQMNRKLISIGLRHNTSRAMAARVIAVWFTTLPRYKYDTAPPEKTTAQ